MFIPSLHSKDRAANFFLRDSLACAKVAASKTSSFWSNLSSSSYAFTGVQNDQHQRHCLPKACLSAEKMSSSLFLASRRFTKHLSRNKTDHHSKGVRSLRSRTLACLYSFWRIHSSWQLSRQAKMDAPFQLTRLGSMSCGRHRIQNSQKISSIKFNIFS